MRSTPAASDADPLDLEAWLIRGTARLRLSDNWGANFDGCRAVDFNDDGVISLLDLTAFSAAYGSSDPRVDVDGSGVVDDEDLPFLSGFFGQTCSGCTANLVDTGKPATVDAADRAALEAAYNLDCRGDLNRDGVIDDDLDLDLFSFYFGRSAPPGSVEARADFNGDQVISLADFGAFASMVGNDCKPDLNKDGAVDTNDLWVLLASWGSCP